MAYMRTVHVHVQVVGWSKQQVRKYSRKEETNDEEERKETVCTCREEVKACEGQGHKHVLYLFVELFHEHPHCALLVANVGIVLQTTISNKEGIHVGERQ